MKEFLGDGTIFLENQPSVISCAAAVGPMEGKGPLGDRFDFIADDATLDEKTWEKSESSFQQYAFNFALTKAGLTDEKIDYIFAGDLLDQCTGSSYAQRETKIPFFGLYGACSTMAESLTMASLFINAGYGSINAAVTSSHFCSAERQFRFPVNYGGVRPPTAQWTVTGSGCAIVSKHSKPPFIKSVTTGKIVDMGITDANNMGAAMAGAAYDTISRHIKNTSTVVSDYDLILTGDLGYVGSEILKDLFMRDNIDISANHNDCGLMIFDREKQDVHSGGSGCGCSASVLCGHIFKEIESGRLNNVLFVATGALMSPIIVQQSESIPGIAHALHITGDE